MGRIAARRSGRCACGWRGAAEYPLGRATIDDRPLYEADIDLTGPLADWNAHLFLVRVPLPEPLAAVWATSPSS
ncbi:hypothetical protein ACWGQT_03830 [Streptomyces yangpuensis]|uniref:hypothetical protein n=1 Tax=Streptomyces yangpuensis TaxID=1648182 RepID=UPI003659E34B